ncbi:MAG: hypothetical protein ACFB0B_18635 [Thermonemataceae bacterium]
MHNAAPPILLNPLKHHLGYVKGFILQASVVQDLSKLLQTIGTSQMDLYTGTLSIGAIAEEVKQWLQEGNLFERQHFITYLNQNEGYHVVELSDTSRWVLREGKDLQRYAHIHPARYSPHSIRVKANSWKTVIAVRLALGEGAHHLQSINQVRQIYLALSPIKAINTEKGIGKLLLMV